MHVYLCVHYGCVWVTKVEIIPLKCNDLVETYEQRQILKLKVILYTIVFANLSMEAIHVLRVPRFIFHYHGTMFCRL